MNLKLDNIYIELFFYLFLPSIILGFTIINILALIKKKEKDKKYRRNHIIIIVLYLIILILASYKDEIEKYILKFSKDNNIKVDEKDIGEVAISLKGLTKLEIDHVLNMIIESKNNISISGRDIITVINNKEYVVLQIIKDDYIIADVKRESKNLTIYRNTIKKYKFPGIMKFYYDSFENIKVEDKEEK